MKQETVKNLSAFRVLVLLALAALFSLGAHNVVRAQTATPTPTPLWTQSGTDIGNTNAGNVGIGTASPPQRLTVDNTVDNYTKANLRLRSLTPRYRSDFTIGSTNGLGINAFDDTAGVYLPIHIEASKTILGMRGNVGVGTTAPGANLDVKGSNLAVRATMAGTTGASGKFQIFSSDITGNPFAEMQFYAPTGAGSEYLRFNISNSDSGVYADALTINRTGNIGIGTASPAYKLDVQGGRLNASGGLCIAGICKSSWSEVGGSSQWTTSGSNISYGAGGVVIGANTQNLYGFKLIISDPTAGSGVSNFLNLSNYVDADLDFKITQAGAGTKYALISPSPANVPLALSTNSGGRVGIGTTNPGGKFEVAGGSVFFGDMGQPGWGNMIVRGRVFSASGNIHLSPPGGKTVYIDSNYREAGGAGGTVNLEVSGTIKGGTIEAKYQDMAEWVPSTQKLQAGTVVVLDAERTNHVLASSSSYDTAVAGVVSEMPGLILGEAGDGKLKVATTGRVKVKVDATLAPIKIGDLLVTSETPGVAMKSEPVAVGGRRLHAPGTIIGKALEPLAKGVGEILVLLSLQ